MLAAFNVRGEKKSLIRSMGPPTSMQPVLELLNWRLLCENCTVVIPIHEIILKLSNKNVTPGNDNGSFSTL